MKKKNLLTVPNNREYLGVRASFEILRIYFISYNAYICTKRMFDFAKQRFKGQYSRYSKIKDLAIRALSVSRAKIASLGRAP